MTHLNTDTRPSNPERRCAQNFKPRWATLLSHTWGQNLWDTHRVEVTVPGPEDAVPARFLLCTPARLPTHRTEVSGALYAEGSWTDVTSIQSVTETGTPRRYHRLALGPGDAAGLQQSQLWPPCWGRALPSGCGETPAPVTQQGAVGPWVLPRRFRIGCFHCIS